MAEDKQAGQIKDESGHVEELELVVAYVPTKDDKGNFFLEIRVGGDTYMYRGDKEFVLPPGVDASELAAHYAPIAALWKYAALGEELELIVERVKRSAAHTVGSARREAAQAVNGIRAELKKVMHESGLLAQQRADLVTKMEQASRGASLVISTSQKCQQRLDAFEPAMQRLGVYAGILATIEQATKDVQARVKAAEEDVLSIVSAAEALREQRTGLEVRLAQVAEKTTRSEATWADVTGRLSQLDEYVAGQQNSLADRFADANNNLEALETELRGFVKRKGALEKIYADAAGAEALLDMLDVLSGRVEQRQAEVDALRVKYSDTVTKLMQDAREQFAGLSGKFNGLGDEFDRLSVMARQNTGDAAQQRDALQKVRELLEQARPAYEATAGLWQEVAEAKAELARARESAGAPQAGRAVKTLGVRL